MSVIFRVVYFGFPVTMTHLIFGKNRQLPYPPGQKWELYRTYLEVESNVFKKGFFPL